MPHPKINSATNEEPVSQNIVELDDVCLTLKGPGGKSDILKNISLSISSGERISLVGPSGSGKTSLLMVIAGLEQIQRGQMIVCGKNLPTLDEDGLALYRRHHIGIVFQDFHLLPTMTATENVALPMEFASQNNAFERAREELRAVGLEHRLDHYPGQLSGGEQQRVALARALATRPQLLLADEPTGNLDSATSENIIELLFDLSKSRKATLILITHDSELAARCDRIITLNDGAIATDQQP